MSTTAMNFTLSSTLLQNLTGSPTGTTSGNNNGVYVYAIAFDSAGNQVNSTTLISNGNYQPGNLALQLTSDTAVPGAPGVLPTLNGGNVLVITQETGVGGTSDLLTSTNTFGYFTTPANSVSASPGKNFRYNAIEVTLLGEGSDVADLTNITQFGSPVALTVDYSVASGLPQDSRGYAVTGQTIVDALNALSPPGSQGLTFGNVGPLPATEQRETVTAGTNIVPNPLNNASDWNSYVNGFVDIAGNVRLATYFSGGAGLPPASLSYYEVEYSNDTFWLVPVSLDGLAQTNYTIGIPATVTQTGQVNALTQNIYFQTGTLSVYDAPGGTLLNTYTSFTPNNAYGDIAKFFVAGFDAGYWGGSANSLNPLVSTPVDLDKTWNWGADYAYGAINAAPGTNNYGYTNSIGTGTGTVGDPDRKMYLDPFAAEFVKYSNTYGYSYSDLISAGGGVNPGISVYDPGTGTNVTSIGVTLLDLNDATPTVGYKAPTHNYVAPSPGMTYSPATTSSTDQFLFDFSLAGTYAPVDGTPISFSFYAPGQTQAGTDGFVTLALPADYDQTYQIVNTGGTWSLTTIGTNALGNFNITDVPVTGSATAPGWYQISIGQGSTAKTYNIYEAATASAVTAAVIDGGATAQLIPGQPNQVKFIFANQGITYDPGYFASSNPTPAPSPPPQVLAAPLVGNNEAGSFTTISTLTDLKQGDFAFSWTGDNAIIAGNIAKLVISNTGSSSWIIPPVVTQSTFDGDWLTPMSSQLGNGTYSTFMQQYKPTDWALATPVGNATLPVDFTVNLDTLALGATTAGGGPALGLTAGGSSTLGNWISLTATESTLPNGTLVAFATDGAGNMIDRDGSGTTTSLAAATLARIGVVKSDSGALFFSGDQSVYLPVGQNLKFAIITGDDVVDASPTIGVTGTGTLAVTVAGSAGQFNLTATVDNTLTESAVLAASQRTTDHSWIYLTQGTEVEVSQAWSGSYVNTLHFVRMDVDPVDATQWRVGGVAYGDTDAFRDAVQANWETFSSTQGNSTGTATSTWTVGGGTGYYAPVLVSPDGMWTINASPTSTANADGAQHIRNFGENLFGFEDMSASNGADFDYNDMIMKLTV